MLDIAEVARTSGLPASTLRFYEEKGLITSAGRNGLRRQFEEDVISRLALISLGRSAGFSLAEIADMLGSEALEIDRDRLRVKANELNKKIKKLTVMRDYLHHAADCPAPSHFECPTFQRLLRLANKSRFKQPTGLI